MKADKSQLIKIGIIALAILIVVGYGVLGSMIYQNPEINWGWLTALFLVFRGLVTTGTSVVKFFNQDSK